MGTVFKLPDLGEGLQEAEIVTWHVGIGDHIVADQPLVSVETEKAIVELPSPQSGHIAALLAAPGDVVAVGAPLVEFTSGQAADAGAIVGEIREENVARPRPKTAARSARIKASPAVRRLAHRLGVDLEAVAASGPDSSITKADVEAAGSTVRASKIRGVRRAMLKNMTRAGAEVVPATVTDEADIEAWPAGTDATVRLIRALISGCTESPSLNAWFDPEHETRTLHAEINLGIAVETEEGLFVPVMQGVEKKDAAALRAGLDSIKQAIGARSVAPSELAGPTITLSNFGMFGGRHADLVVVPPQVAILGAGRAEPRAVAVAGRVAVHRVLPLSLTFDHRVVTGVEAARFLNAVVAALEKSEE